MCLPEIPPTSVIGEITLVSLCNMPVLHAFATRHSVSISDFFYHTHLCSTRYNCCKCNISRNIGAANVSACHGSYQGIVRSCSEHRQTILISTPPWGSAHVACVQQTYISLGHGDSSVTPHRTILGDVIFYFGPAHLLVAYVSPIRRFGHR